MIALTFFNVDARTASTSIATTAAHISLSPEACAAMLATAPQKGNGSFT